jgi:hypothetical protein
MVERTKRFSLSIVLIWDECVVHYDIPSNAMPSNAMQMIDKIGANFSPPVVGKAKHAGTL